jgi:hypothetical protein
MNKNEIQDISYIDDVTVLDKKYGIKGSLIDGIFRDTEGNIITMPSDIEEKRQQLIDEINSTLYQKRRAREYPPITDYLDAVVKGDQDAIDEYINKCLAIKAKYPKP